MIEDSKPGIHPIDADPSIVEDYHVNHQVNSQPLVSSTRRNYHDQPALELSTNHQPPYDDYIERNDIR
jgi:hypothetical protein